MLKNHNLARSIADAGRYHFVQLLTCKPRGQGRELVKVVPHHSSQDCWVCGWRNTGPQLSDRTCGNGHVLDRDVNAAIHSSNRAVGQSVTAWERYNGKGRVAQEAHLLRAVGVST